MANEERQLEGLSLQDLILTTQIIQLGSQRGAYRAEELAQIGSLYNKLVVFLTESGAISPANPEETKND